MVRIIVYNIVKISNDMFRLALCDTLLNCSHLESWRQMNQCHDACGQHYHHITSLLIQVPSASSTFHFYAIFHTQKAITTTHPPSCISILHLSHLQFTTVHT